MKIRGVMIDAARLTEKKSYYISLFKRLSIWGYNTVLLHIMDDEGCAVIFDDLNILPTAGALSENDWKELAEIANANGIDLIPEVESLGHTGYITRLPQYEHLREPPSKNGLYWSIAPVIPETQEILSEVIKKTLDIFPCKYVHLGMDEADIGGSESTINALKEMSKSSIFANHINFLTETLESYGKIPMMWGDHLLKDAEIAKLISKNIVICNWQYGRGYCTNYAATNTKLVDLGFKVIAAPAICWDGTLMLPHKDNMENISDFTELCRADTSGDILGVINTVWCPYRYLPNAIILFIAWAGALFRQKISFETFLQNYLDSEYKDSKAVEGLAVKLSDSILLRDRSKLEIKIMKGTLLSDVEIEQVENLRAILKSIIDEFEEFRSKYLLNTELQEIYSSCKWLYNLFELAMIDSDNILQHKINLKKEYEAFLLENRTSTGTFSSEPSCKQRERYWQFSDHPLEVL